MGSLMRLTAENGWRATTRSAGRRDVGVLGGGPPKAAADVRAQVRRRQDLDVVAPLEDPQPDLDRAADRCRPQQRAVWLALRPLLGMPAGFEDAIGDRG